MKEIELIESVITKNVEIISFRKEDYGFKVSVGNTTYLSFYGNKILLDKRDELEGIETIHLYKEQKRILLAIIEKLVLKKVRFVYKIDSVPCVKTEDDKSYIPSSEGSILEISDKGPRLISLKEI